MSFHLHRRKLRQALINIFKLIVCAWLCLMSIPASAQTQPNNYAIVRIYTAGTANSALAVLAPGNADPVHQDPIFSGLNTVLSADSQWVSSYGLMPGSTSPQLFYGPYPQTTSKDPTIISLDVGFYPIFARFSADSRYLFYTAVSYAEQRWIMGMIELASGAATTFTGEHSYDPSTQAADTGFSGVAEGVNIDNGKLLVASVQLATSSIGRYNGLYSVDPSTLAVGGENTKFPPAELVLAGDKVIGLPLLSPDGKKIAYLTSDRKDSQVPAALAVLDLASGEEHILAHAAKGQAIATLSWQPDSQSILYTAGGPKNTPYVVMPQAYTLDTSTAKVSVGPVLLNDPKLYLFSTMVCGDTLYYVTKIYKPDFSGVASLYSAPLNDLAGHGKPLASGQNIGLLSCTSADSVHSEKTEK